MITELMLVAAYSAPAFGEQMIAACVWGVAAMAGFFVDRYRFNGRPLL